MGLSQDSPLGALPPFTHGTLHLLACTLKFVARNRFWYNVLIRVCRLTSPCSVLPVNHVLLRSWPPPGMEYRRQSDCAALPSLSLWYKRRPSSLNDVKQVVQMLFRAILSLLSIPEGITAEDRTNGHNKSLGSWREGGAGGSMRSRHSHDESLGKNRWGSFRGCGRDRQTEQFAGETAGTSAEGALTSGTTWLLMLLSSLFFQGGGGGVAAAGGCVVRIRWSIIFLELLCYASFVNGPLEHPVGSPS